MYSRGDSGKVFCHSLIVNNPTSSPGYAAPLVNQHALLAQPVTSLDEAMEAASSVKLSAVYLTSSQLTSTWLVTRQSALADAGNIQATLHQLAPTAMVQLQATIEGLARVCAVLTTGQHRPVAGGQAHFWYIEV